MGESRAMLHDKGLPFHLWAEECNTMVFMRNRSPHRILGMSTPEEGFLGKKIDVSYLKNFGLLVISNFCYLYMTKYLS